MDRFLNAMMAQSASQAGAHGQPRIGIVTSYNPADGTAKVKLQPEDVLTGWLPVASMWVGSGWGVHFCLQADDQVLVVPQDGDTENGIIIGRMWSDKARPPPVENGEMLLRHQSGSFFKLQADGTVRIKGETYIDGNLFVSKNILATMQITDLDNAHGTLSQVREAYRDHHHGLSPAPDHSVP